MIDLSFDTFQKSQSTAPRRADLSYDSFLKTRSPEPSTPFGQQAIKTLPNTMSSLAELQIDPLSLKANPHEAIGSALKSVDNAFIQEGKNIRELFDAGSVKSSASQIIGSFAKTLAGGASIALAPISALFEGANNIPVLGTVSKLISLPFVAAGEVATKTSDAVIDHLPISQEAKDNIKPGIGEILSLAAQIAVGKASDIATKKIGELTTKYGAKDAQTIVTKAQELATERQAEIAKTNEVSKPANLSYEAFKTEVPQPTTSPEVVKGGQASMGVETGEQVTNTRAQTLEQAAVAKKLTEGLGDLPTHSKIDMTEQANSALDFVEKNKDQALKIAKGEDLSPGHILPESVYTALEIKAMKEGDVKTILELSKSTIPTEAGQRLKALDSNDPNSPVKILRDIQGERQAKAVKERPKVVDQINTEIRKSASKRVTWEEFIKEVRCNY